MIEFAISDAEEIRTLASFAFQTEKCWRVVQSSLE